MTRTKIIFSTMLATILLATQIIAVGAAPTYQETTPISGTVTNISLETDTETGVTTVLVTLEDETGTQTVRLSLEDAITLELVADDGSGPVVDDSKIDTSIDIDPALVIPDSEDKTTIEEAQHPVGSRLSDFFSDLLGVDYETIMDYHEEGAGFGVIAQALWMTNALNENGDSDISSEDLFKAILDAKLSKDFEAVPLPDGSIAKNWGQFRKAVMSDRDKSKENLGAVMSGRAENGQNNEAQLAPKNNGKAPDKVNPTDKTKNAEKSNNGVGQDKNKGNGKDKNQDKGNGKNK